MQQRNFKRFNRFNEQSDHKLTIHHVPTNTPQITSDWSRSRIENMVLKIQKREREPSSYYYGPVGPEGTTHTWSWRQQAWCRWLRQWLPPPAELRNRPPDWNLCETGACGGDKILLEARRRVSVFIGNYGGGIRSRAVRGPHMDGGAPYPPGRATCPCGPLVALLDLSRSFQVSCCPKKSC